MFLPFTDNENRRHRRDRSRSLDRHKSKSSKHSSESTKQPPPTADNSFLEFVPRSANFIEDIPNLRSEDAYRLDRRPDVNNRAFSTLYAQHVPRYLPRDVLDHTRSFKDKKKPSKPKKIKRYFVSKKKSSKPLEPESNEPSCRLFIYPRESILVELGMFL